MNSFFASLIPLAAISVLVIPLVAAARSASHVMLKWALSSTLLVSGAVALAQSGLLSPAVPSWVTTAATFSSQTDPAKCDQLIGALQQYGVLTEPARPGMLVVSGSIWSKLPPEAQQMAQMCAGKDGAPADVSFAPER